ncbi:MAG: ribosome silencing factor [Bacteroidales bacterium]|nr:ribosome silencing factor [Bacteroidales bacterium]
MAKTKQKNESEILSDIIIKGIQEKKGKEIISLNLSEIQNAVCNYFVICHGDSKIQVEAIADSIEEKVRKVTGVKPWHKEGFENAEWILIDYVDVVAHIFREDTRMFYNLENLWADAKKKRFEYEE